MTEKLTAEQLRDKIEMLCHDHPERVMASELLALRAERAKLEAEVLLADSQTNESNYEYHVSEILRIIREGIAQPAESEATKCIVCSRPLGERQTYIPTAKGPMHPLCWERAGAKP